MTDLTLTNSGFVIGMNSSDFSRYSNGFLLVSMFQVPFGEYMCLIKTFLLMRIIRRLNDSQSYSILRKKVDNQYFTKIMKKSV